MSDDKYRKLVSKSLKEVENRGGKNINESRIKYDEGHSERMNPSIERRLRERNHSLGAHPIFPDSDEAHFEEKIMSDRFRNVLQNYKRQFDTNNIDHNQVLRDSGPQWMELMNLEGPHKKQLEELAVRMVREEYDMSEDDVNIIVELTPNINTEGTQKNPAPIAIDEVEFDDHDAMSNANDEVYKRRFLNAMIQGSAKKSSHMFHLVDQELMEMDPTLPSKYSKMMAAADYMYYIIDEMDNTMVGGISRVEFPSKEGEKPTIHAQAMNFPVLIHELVKGVMELLSSHGLPQDTNVRKYVIGKSDFLAAEPDDMRLGPAIWEKFTDAIPADDFNLKHHVYHELAALPVKEFNRVMREVMAGTKSGKNSISEIVDNIKNEMSLDEYEDAMKTDDSDDGFMGFDDLDSIDFGDID